VQVPAKGIFLQVRDYISKIAIAPGMLKKTAEQTKSP
jgi:hypothetical protein